MVFTLVFFLVKKKKKKKKKKKDIPKENLKKLICILVNIL